MGVVSDYLAGLDGAVRGLFERYDALVRSLAPDLTEGMSYGMPALLYRGKGLFAARQTKSHLAVYPFSGEVLPALSAELAGFSTSQGAVQFSLEHPLPDELVRRIVDARMAEIDAQLNR
ncbi:iron chaperone [Diaminobutyricimonas sp. LJ205]|uniref:iron chaperone n=1 Tax=Diaminobutyricimonas sp. LJ205 TaxID=2683590 RepID=UPI0012F4A684|nr:DUF1801 domain-containing protein [Diaminobutyricimonas sp. LJ205]